jgi:hypothetical protein
MSVLSRRAAGRDAADAHQRASFSHRAATEPMLPVVISGVLFIATLAMPFVAALLIQ